MVQLTDTLPKNGKIGVSVNWTIHCRVQKYRDLYEENLVIIGVPTKTWKSKRFISRGYFILGLEHYTVLFKNNQIIKLFKLRRI